MQPYRALLPVALALSLLAPAAAQNAKSSPPQDAEPSVFGESIEVRVVNLEVVVVDKSGQRVAGLRPSDFRLTVDGKPLAIDYFTEVAEGKAVAEGTGAGTAPASAAPTTPNVAGLEPGGAVGTSYVVFVDNSFIRVPRDRNVVLRGVIDGLSRLGPQDRMAVVAFNGKKPVMLSSWSQSATTLRQALEDAIAGRSQGLSTAAELAGIDAIEALDPNETAAGGPTREELGLGARNNSEVASACILIHRMENRLQRVVTGVTSTMRSLAAAPGRKVMLLVSGGWPRSAGEYVLGSIDPSGLVPGCKMIGPPLYEPINETANRVGFTLYPILAPDLPSAIDAEHTSSPDPASVNPQARFSQLQETLYRLADQTGGRAYAAAARLDALNKVVDDTRSYYWLGFTPTWKGDDRAHKVKVDLTRPGLEVRNRAGFQDLSRKAEVTYMVESALMFGKAPGTYPLQIKLGPVPDGRRDKTKVPLKIAIPMQNVTMVQRGKQYVAELELRIALLNDDGDRNDIPVIPVKLAGKELPQPGQYSIYTTELEVRRAHQEVVVALFDPASGKTLMAKTVLEP